MAQMLLSRVRLQPGAAADESFWRMSRQDPLGHHSIWSLFPGEEPGTRPFLYRQEATGTEAAFLVLSRRQPTDESGLWVVETKELSPVLREGEQLQFALRVNPTLRRGRRQDDAPEGETAVGKRVDVVMDAKWRARQRGETPDERTLVQTATRSWLAARGERAGFRLDDDGFQAEAYRQHRVPRRGKPAATFSTVDLTGELIVDDVERFLSAMTSGLGPEKAFGCGLLLIRRG